jgi:hypothetical protein
MQTQMKKNYFLENNDSFRIKIKIELKNINLV